MMGKSDFSDLLCHIQRNPRDNTSLILLYSGVRYRVSCSVGFIRECRNIVAIILISIPYRAGRIEDFIIESAIELRIE